MSGGYQERRPVITSEATQEFHSWPITSLRALCSALEHTQCSFKKLQEFSDLSAAEIELMAANKALDECAALSLEQAGELNEAVERAIAANQSLQGALQAADAARPSTLNVNYRGKSYNLTWKNGSYQISWQENKIYSDGVYSRTDANENARAFVNALTQAYVNAEDQFKQNRSAEKKRFNLGNAELEQRMEQAIRIQGQWEAIEENNRIKQLRLDRKEAVIERATSLDLDCEVTEVGKQIILTIGGSAFTQGSSSGNDDPFGSVSL